MAAGLPAVVTRNGGPSESLIDENGQYGILVDPEDVQDIATKIKSLANDPQLWHEMQTAGLQRVQDKYTWERTADAYSEVFQRIESQKSTASDKDDTATSIDSYLQSRNIQWLKDLYYGND
jgi:sucrose-phosphate synthase